MTKSVIIYGQADCDGGFATLSVEVALAKALLIAERGELISNNYGVIINGSTMNHQWAITLAKAREVTLPAAVTSYKLQVTSYKLQITSVD